MKRTWLDLANQADHWMRGHRDEWIGDLRTLARVPSISRPDLARPGAPFGPECRRVLDLALEIGRKYGFTVRDLDGYAGIITLGREEDAVGIFVHLDVVPAGEGWIYPPFDATWLPDEEMLIGRGVEDNKGSFVMALSVMRMLREFGIPLHHGISLYCGTSEENGMGDMAALREKGVRFPTFSLVPDSRFPVNFGQKGSLKGYITAPAEGNLLSFEAGSALNMVPDRAACTVGMEEQKARRAFELLPDALKERLRIENVPNGVKISAFGLAGHAAHPEGSVNAIYLLADALCRMKLLHGSCESAVSALSALSEDYEGHRIGVAFTDEISGPLTVVHSTARLREGLLEVGFDCRFPITLSGEKLTASFVAAWESLGFTPGEMRRTDPFYLPPDDPRVALLQDIYHALTGRDDPPYTMGGGTYSRVVPNAVTFGAKMPLRARAFSLLPPGHGAAHGPDEALPLEMLESCARIYLPAIAALDELPG